MELAELIKVWSGHRESSGRVLKVLRNIQRLKAQSSWNLPKLDSELGTLNGILQRREAASGFSHDDISSWAREFSAKLAEQSERQSQVFGSQLEKILSTEGLTLQKWGDDLSAGLFVITLRRDSGKVKIWYGPKIETVADCPLTPEDISSTLVMQREQLGSRLPPQEFVNRLRRACSILLSEHKERWIPLYEVLPALALLVQEQKFRDNPTRQNYLSYSRADFSFDLFRTRALLRESGIKLRVATLAKTRTKRGNLWVPQSESVGGGGYYSDISHDGDH